MTSVYANPAPAGNSAIDTTKLEAAIRASFLGGAGAKGFNQDGTSDWAMADASRFASGLLAGVRDAATADPRLISLARKSPLEITITDPSELAMKGWFSSVLQVVQTVAPVILQAMSKDFKAQTPSLSEIAQTVPPARLQDKDFLDFVTHLLVTLGPAVVQAAQGTKDFTDPSAVPAIVVPQGKDKGWFSDALNVVTRALPTVLPLVLAAI